MSTAWIGVGSNVGDRAGFCRQAVDELKNSGVVQVDAASSLYETSPVGGPPQRSFINLVVGVSTDATPRQLLELAKSIEKRLGRETDQMRWGPRIVDLDILAIDGVTVAEADLQIPHPRLTERAFALIPLLEIDPGVSDPTGKPYAAFLPEAEGEAEVLEPF
ncbi:MAG: 2-amino-4-hydroxy-6-hydroxymethyldihydropteridine diphosphokinase [Actinomycetota bacterium]